VKRLLLLIVLVVLVVILAASSASAVSDTAPTYGEISNNEITTNQTVASNSSTSATITITMTGIIDE
jgi:anionic cell wall polymer biosynthesis LytR-Cps2A-Psr (LCP) family protein